VPALSPNIENRVRKLPKPSNATQGLQPLFEAVSNAFYALEDRFGSEGLEQGRVTITVNDLADPEKIEVAVRDNGVGFDNEHYDAFCEIDTDFKRLKGGKGVGRLFWLDAFDEIRIDSIYCCNSGPEIIHFCAQQPGSRSSLKATEAQSVPERMLARL
jgi:hypothetical protein